MMHQCRFIFGKNLLFWFSSVQSLSRVRLFVTPWIAARQTSLTITNFWSSLKLTSIESVMPSRHLILCHPCLLLLPPIPPSIRVFSNQSALHMRLPKYWNFSSSIIPSKEHPGLISFRMDLLDLLAVQGTLKSLLQHHSSKESILQHSAFFIVQLSHPYMTTGKTIAWYDLNSWKFAWQEIPYLVKVKVAQSCPTLCDSMDCTVHGILQARKLEWLAIPFSRESPQPRDRTQVSCTREA